MTLSRIWKYANKMAAIDYLPQPPLSNRNYGEPEPDYRSRVCVRHGEVLAFENGYCMECASKDRDTIGNYSRDASS